MGEQVELSFEEFDKEIEAIVKTKTKGSRATKETKLLDFKRILNQKPSNKFLKTNEFYGNKYIPIEILERMLGALYISYQFIIRTQPIVEQGNIIFFVDVVLTNPVTLNQEVYSGVSATPIMPRNGSFTDIHPHIPAAKSFAIMNACKHIGRLFRAENDKCTDIFNSYFEKKIEEVAVDPLEKRIHTMIESAKSESDLIAKVGITYTRFDSTNIAFEKKLTELRSGGK